MLACLQLIPDALLCLRLQADMSRVLLEQGYWVSYNVPYFPNVYNISGVQL